LLYAWIGLDPNTRASMTGIMPSLFCGDGNLMNLLSRLGSNHSPVSAFWVASITGVSHCTQLMFIILCNIVFQSMTEYQFIHLYLLLQ
jgi:hypothetical protein